jgi:DNA mismatch endonuclease (patch repair protein)
VADHLSEQARSGLMSRIRGGNTKPEMAVRRCAHALGYRFRLHRRDLPGTPDLVFPSRRKVVFVHGCWWHRHEGCVKSGVPKTRPAYWSAKFDQNVARDARVEGQLRAAGWDVLVIWECETRDPNEVDQLLNAYLNLVSLEIEGESG